MKCDHKWKIVRMFIEGGKWKQRVKCLQCGMEKDEPQTTPLFSWIGSW